MALAAENPLTTATPALLSDDTRLGGVELVVSDLARSIDFYTRVIGLTVRERREGSAALGAGGEDLVVLHEDRAARRPGRESGLYHFALLFPTRAELARAALRLAVSRTPIDGASDHGTHEAIYLPDPDGIGIELAADRPREQWPASMGEEFAAHGPAPLDVQGLLASIAGEEPTASAAAGVTIGHVHLHVGALEPASAFYRDGLGLAIAFELPSAVFATFGGYHHRVAYNLWRGAGAPPAAADAVGLRHWTLFLGSDEERAALGERLTALGAQVEQRDGGLFTRDPAGIAVLIR